MHENPVQQTRETTTSTKPGGEKSTGGGGLKQQLRTMSFVEGETALAPVQLMEMGYGANYGGYGMGIELPGKQGGKRQQKNNAFENLLEGKNRDGTIADIYGKYDVGTGTTLTELWSMVQGVVQGTLPEGAKHFAEVTGILNVLGVLGFGAKLAFEVGKQEGGKTTVKGKIDFANSMALGPAALQAFGAKIKGTFGGAYDVTAVGDDANECFKLMQLGVRAAMRADANVLITADEAEKLAALRAGKEEQSGVLLGALRWTWRKLRSAATAILAPDDHAEYRMSQLLDLMWNGDAGESYDVRAAEAVAGMDEQDTVSVTKSQAGKVGAEGSVLGSEASAEAGVTGATVTTLTKDDALTGGTQTKHKVFKAEAGLDLSKLAGLKGKVAYEREFGAVPAHGELEAEFEGGVGNLGALAVGIGASLFKAVFPLVAPKKDNDGGLDGFGQGVFVHAMTLAAIGVQQAQEKAAAAHAHGGGAHGGGHAHPAEVSFAVKWAHSPWKYEGCEVKLVKPLAKAELLGSELEAKAGTKYEFEAPGAEHGKH